MTLAYTQTNALALYVTMQVTLHKIHTLTYIAVYTQTLNAIDTDFALLAPAKWVF